MKRHIVSIGIVLAVLSTVFFYGVLTDNAFGQDEETPAQRMQRERREQQAENTRERLQNMTPEEREKFRQEMLENSKKWENMSDEEREKLRAEMREKFGSSSRGMGYEEQLKSIKAIEEQIARLKAAVEATAPENRSRIRELPDEERTKLREKIMAAMRERQAAIRAIEMELEKLKGPGRTITDLRLQIGELRSIHKLAVEEKATRTAERLERFIARYERETQGRVQPPMQGPGPREGEPRPRRERPVRQEKTE
jgi:uncharacterized membrane protein